MAGGYAAQPHGIDALVARFRAIERRMDSIQRGLTGLGLTIDPQGNLIINENAIVSADFDGTIDPPTAGTQGWALGGPSSIAIINALLLRSGVVTDGALATSPLQLGFGYTSASNYVIPQGTGTTKATVTMAVPAGYTQGLVFAQASDYGHNSTAGTDWLNSQIQITAGSGTTFAVGSSPNCGAGEYTASSASMVNLSTSLSGGNVVVTSKPLTSVGAWSANSVNSTGIVAICLFLR